MADVVDKFLGISGAASGLLSYLFYRLYKSRTETAQRVEHIPVWEADLELFDHLSSVDQHCLAYAAVEGTVKDLGRTLSSQYGKEVGVVQQLKLVEHKSKRVNGFWSDMKKDIKDNSQSVPFAISKPSGGDPTLNIEVMAAEDAYHLQDELDVTYDRFEPRKTSLVEVGLDRLFGEVTKGIQETEKMLVTGTHILGVGKLFLDRGKMRLGPPDDPSKTFILTKMSLSQLVRSYESQSSTFKILAYVFAAVGGGLLAMIIWRHARAYLEKRRQRLEFDAIRRSMRENRQPQNPGDGNDGGDEPDEDSTNACIVCLGEPRQVVALNCGHIALCANCAELLPSPKTCPVCRAPVERFTAVFHP